MSKVEKRPCDFDWSEEMKNYLNEDGNEVNKCSSSKEKLTEENDTETFDERLRGKPEIGGSPDESKDKDQKEPKSKNFDRTEEEVTFEETRDEVFKDETGCPNETDSSSDSICIKCKKSTLGLGWLDRWTGTIYCSVCKEEELEGECCEHK